MANYKIYYSVPGANSRLTTTVDASNSNAARRIFEAGNPGAKVIMVS